MDFEGKIFEKYKPDFDKFIKYGFKIKNNCYYLEKPFLNNTFRAIIEISKNEKIKGRVFDIENESEYLALRVEAQKGEFTGKIREEYKKILREIRDNCFYKECFIFPQTNRISELINNNFRVMPEFLWEKFPSCGVFRNPNSKKWFGIVMDVDKSKIIKNQKGLIEILNVKLPCDMICEKLNQKGYYPAYHMNKKYWISIILDDTLKDNIILDDIKQSFDLSEKK